jgi:ribonuclease P protein component
MSKSKSYSLGKSERLKSRKQIDALFESGKKITQFPFRLLYKTEAGLSGLKAGFAVSSKNFPRAVDRNRIKRLTREAYRIQKKDLEISLSRNSFGIQLFFIYTGKEMVTHEETTWRLKQLLDKLLKNLDENNSANN